MVEIRYIGVPSDERDLAGLFEILCACQHEFVPPLCARTGCAQKFQAGRPNGDGNDRPVAYFEEMRRQHFVVARADGGRLAAFLTFKPRYTCPELLRYGENIYMTTACVLPAWRGRGLSGGLYDVVEGALPAALRTSYVTTRTWSTNQTQMHVFPKRGYEICARLEDDRGAGIDTVYFVKQILGPAAPGT